LTADGIRQLIADGLDECAALLDDIDARCRDLH